MRVISGSVRGSILQAPDGLDTRPTADRMKENLFNMLASDLQDCFFLDLFGGSGAIGIEALSRGARFAAFVDDRKTCADIIVKNLIKTRLEKQAVVIALDFEAALDTFYRESRSFDIVFMDPPYHRGYVEKALFCMARHGILNKGGYVVAEISSDEKLTDTAGFQIFKEKRYRTTAFIFLKQTEAHHDGYLSGEL